MSGMLTRLGLCVMWLLQRLPFPALVSVGRGLGRLLYWFGRERRHVALTNLRLCFPDLPEVERVGIARRLFGFIARSFLERGLLWWAPEARLRQLIRLEGKQHLDTARAERPVLLLVPHFAGLDAAVTRLSMDYDMAGIYSRQKNPVFDAALYRGRKRFSHPVMLSRQDSLRKGIKAIKAGMPFFYLPDMDYGKRDTIFVPFFGVPAATITGLSRLASMTGAAVLPVIARMDDDGYRVEVGAPWTNFPSGAGAEDVASDTRRMNAWLESEIAKMPDQYYWVHKRFKTRPPGEKRFYGR